MKKLLLLSALIPLLLAGCGSPTASSPRTNATTNSSQSNTTGQSNNLRASNGTNSTGGSGQSTSASTTQPTAQPYIVAVHHQTSTQDITYPAFHGLPNASAEARINAQLKQAAMFKSGKDTISESDLQSYTANYALAFKEGNIADIIVTTYVMPKGTAHGMPEEQSLWFNLSTGAEYSIGDLFQSGSPYLQTMTDVIQQEDTKRTLSEMQPFTGVAQHDGFVLQPNGVTVFFGVYEWASFADGILAYPVSYQALSNHINHQGSLWQALQSKQAQQDKSVQQADLANIRSLGYNPLDAAFNQHLSPQAFAAEPDGHGQTLYAFTAEKSGLAGYEKIFFFLGNRYLGTDTAKAHGVVLNLEPTAVGTIAATYASDGKPYSFTIQYHWNGTKLVPNSSFPSGYTEWN